MSAFYSAVVKATAAKKIGALLGLSSEELFAQNVKVFSSEKLVIQDEFVEEPVVKTDINHPEIQSSVEATVKVAPMAEAFKLKTTSRWLTVGLFLAAWAVAGYMRPQDEPVLEPAPPLHSSSAE